MRHRNQLIAQPEICKLYIVKWRANYPPCCTYNPGTTAAVHHVQRVEQDGHKAADKDERDGERVGEDKVEVAVTVQGNNEEHP